MKLGGEYLVIWLEESAARYFLGLPQSDVQKGDWIVSGKAVGETPGVGIWLEMAALYTPGGGTIPTSAKEKPTYLVRWEWVKTARVYKKKPPQGKPKSYGFVLPTDPKP